MPPAITIWLQWSADPAFTLTCIVVVLWWLGGRGARSGRAGRASDRAGRASDRAGRGSGRAGRASGRAGRASDRAGRGSGRAGRARWRDGAFWAGIATIVVALNSPLDIEASRLFWVHMVQHVLLLTVAAPLLVLARPLPRLLRGIPTRERMRLVHWVRRGAGAAPLRLIARPWPAWAAFCTGLLLWHVPALYDLALRHDLIHDLEHLTFIASGLLFWEHALASPPFATSLSWLARTVYITGAMAVGWVLAVALALATTPLYSYYAALASRPGHIDALTDQQIAAGVMWVPGSIAFSIAAAWSLYRFVGSAAPPARPAVLS